MGVVELGEERLNEGSMSDGGAGAASADVNMTGSAAPDINYPGGGDAAKTNTLSESSKQTEPDPAQAPTVDPIAPARMQADAAEMNAPAGGLEPSKPAMTEARATEVINEKGGDALRAMAARARSSVADAKASDVGVEAKEGALRSSAVVMDMSGVQLEPDGKGNSQAAAAQEKEKQPHFSKDAKMAMVGMLVVGAAFGPIGLIAAVGAIAVGAVCKVGYDKIQEHRENQNIKVGQTPEQAKQQRAALEKGESLGKDLTKEKEPHISENAKKSMLALLVVGAVVGGPLGVMVAMGVAAIGVAGKVGADKFQEYREKQSQEAAKPGNVQAKDGQQQGAGLDKEQGKSFNMSKFPAADMKAMGDAMKTLVKAGATMVGEVSGISAIKAPTITAEQNQGIAATAARSG